MQPLHHYHHGPTVDHGGGDPPEPQLPLPSKSESSSSSSPSPGLKQGKGRDEGKDTCHRSSCATPSIATMEWKPRTPDATEVGGGGGGRTAESQSSSSRSAQSHPQPHCHRRQRMQLSSVLKAASTRCFTVTEMMQLLDPETTPLTVSSEGPDPTYPPPSGSLLLYDRADTPNYREDGHNWVMKRVERSTTRRRIGGVGGMGDGDTGGGGESGGAGVKSVLRVREDSVKLRYNGRFHVAGYYTRSAVRRTFRRRAYFLLDPANGCRPLSNWILVHYLDADPRRPRGGGCGCDADTNTSVGSSVAPTPALFSGAENITVGSSTETSGSGSIKSAAEGEEDFDDDPLRRPPPQAAQSIGGGGTGNENDDPLEGHHRPMVSTAFMTAEESCRRMGLVTVPGMTPRVGVTPIPAAPGAGHHRRVEDIRWYGVGVGGGPMRGDVGMAAMKDDPHDLLHPAASSRAEPPGAGWLKSSAPVISAAAALGVTVDGGKEIGSAETMKVDGGPNPCLHLSGDRPQNQLMPQHRQQQQNQPQLQHQTRTRSRPQPQPQLQPQLQPQPPFRTQLQPQQPQSQSQPKLETRTRSSDQAQSQSQPPPQPQPQLQPQPPFQTQLQLEPQHQQQIQQHHIGASSSLTRILLSLSDLRSAPKFNDEHLAHEWRSFTEEERRELIADLYGSAMVLDGDGAGENGGAGGTDAGAGTGCGGSVCRDDGGGGGGGCLSSSRSSSPRDVAEGGGGAGCHGANNSPFIRELMAEVEALRMSLMDEAIVDGMPADSEGRAVYLEAVRRCPMQATSLRMKSWFLWCEDLCPKAAAHRMVRYWSKRVEYFGSERAFRPFTLGDGGTLGTDEFYDELATGFARLLPGTDASGRGIMFCDNSKKCSFATRLRVTMYMAHAALENESVVRNGLVLVAFGPMPVQNADRRLILERQQLLRDSLPVRIRAMHWCNPSKDKGDWISRDAHEVASFTAGRRWRARVLLHQGSREHLVLQLGEYGISLSQLPAEIGGGLGEDVFQQWLASRRMRCL